MIFRGIQQGAPMEPMGILKWDSYKQGAPLEPLFIGSGSCQGVCRRISRISEKIPQSVGTPCLWEIFILVRSHLKCRTELFNREIFQITQQNSPLQRSALFIANNHIFEEWLQRSHLKLGTGIVSMCNQVICNIPNKIPAPHRSHLKYETGIVQSGNIPNYATKFPAPTERPIYSK